MSALLWELSIPDTSSEGIAISLSPTCCYFCSDSSSCHDDTQGTRIVTVKSRTRVTSPFVWLNQLGVKVGRYAYWKI
ncbi:uncharacterized protein BCR38DRAFT_428667 [Pseudomassariella vexata]|uniref:Uncharacterized protein n=1 Tax=Pseudomassariella vexata TaxID=1141098 RepID=A0A1Y2E3L8_9PEZI|nr:uncharacterized protein BCR38DRAFT_428667 [Pseudomassariella vexata]ORY65896.1 hypothetical protein BCR38DRAFT_428667 [Pseudomassariella vexata]